MVWSDRLFSGVGSGTDQGRKGLAQVTLSPGLGGTRLGAFWQAGAEAVAREFEHEQAAVRADGVFEAAELFDEGVFDVPFADDRGFRRRNQGIGILGEGIGRIARKRMSVCCENSGSFA
jgi:hypothetical protein